MLLNGTGSHLPYFRFYINKEWFPFIEGTCIKGLTLRLSAQLLSTYTDRFGH